MLILPKQNALFYHVYKAAGTSVRNALLPYAKRSQVLGQYVNHVLAVARIPHSQNPVLQYHPDLREVRASLGAKYDSFYKFAFVREPLDWQKSLYHFMIKKPHLPGNARISGMSFEEYLTWRMDNELKFQGDMLFDAADCLVDDIFQFETLDRDFAAVAEKLKLDCSLRHLNRAGYGKSVNVSSKVLDRFRRLHEEEYRRLGYTK